MHEATAIKTWFARWWCRSALQCPAQNPDHHWTPSGWTGPPSVLWARWRSKTGVSEPSHGGPAWVQVFGVFFSIGNSKRPHIFILLVTKCTAKMSSITFDYRYTISVCYYNCMQAFDSEHKKINSLLVVVLTSTNTVFMLLRILFLALLNLFFFLMKRLSLNTQKHSLRWKLFVQVPLQILQTDYHIRYAPL